MPKLIVLRGNSGTGKSTVARLVRERARSGLKVAIVEQDYLRRIVLKEKENEGTANIGLIQQTVSYCLGRGYHVVLEGILYSKRYGDMISTLVGEAACWRRPDGTRPLRDSDFGRIVGVCVRISIRRSSCL